jgi:hypothetical protein
MRRCKVRWRLGLVRVLEDSWSLDGEVAPEDQTVDSYLRQEGLGLVLFLRVEYLTEVKAR